jgi:hypothetical protein
VKNRFQSLPFKCNLQRYTMSLDGGRWFPVTLYADKSEGGGAIPVGAVQVRESSCVTHTLKAPGFTTLEPV